MTQMLICICVVSCTELCELFHGLHWHESETDNLLILDFPSIAAVEIVLIRLKYGTIFVYKYNKVCIPAGWSHETASEEYTSDKVISCAINMHF